MHVMPDSSYLLHLNMRDPLPVIDRGEGIYLFDQDGKRYIDGSSGPVACNIGHGNGEVVEAMAAQARRVAFVYRTHFTSDAIEQFARLICDMAPPTLNRVLFTNSGSDAVEIAARIARQYHLARGQDKRYLIISRWLSYHGITGDALSMSGHVVRRQNFIPTLQQYPKIPACYCYRCPLGREPSSCEAACAHTLEDTLRLVGPEYVSAFIAEPMVGAAGGAMTPPAGYFPAIRDICSRHGILFIADEVMTGFGRTGKNFGLDHWDVVPDICVFAKGAGAGYWPTAGAIVSDSVYSTLRDGAGTFFPGHTYTATPMMGAVGVAVLEYLEKNGLVEHVARHGPYLLERLSGLRHHRIVGDVRGRGFFAGIELVRNPESKEPFEFTEYCRAANTLIDRCFRNGLIIYPGGGTVDGFRGDHVLVAPPLIMQRPEIDLMVDILDRAMGETADILFGSRLPSP